jgi:fumarylacetoacetase
VLNETHDPALISWIDGANQPACDYPLQNLPFGVFRRAGSEEPYRGGVAIGDQILDLRGLAESRMLSKSVGPALEACSEASLNRFMALGPTASSALRLQLSYCLRAGAPNVDRMQGLLVPQAQAEFSSAAVIGDFTDFYASIHHALSVGRLFRPENPLLPNYPWIPVGYHGRSSSVVVSGTAIRRPSGQVVSAPGQAPVYLPSRRLDFELEAGIVIGAGNELGTAVPIGEAEAHVFGLCLLNDWSARDLQSWEYQPLGPFLGKNFATTISPWIVTMEALAPFRAPFVRDALQPRPLPYLDDPKVWACGGLDISLEVSLQTQRMREVGQPPLALSTSNLRHAYWTVAQLVAHHASNGCNLRAGDLMGSGTMSGPEPSEAGSLLELTGGGQSAIMLPSGETRRFLEDGDQVVMRGWCERRGFRRIGFGRASGIIVAARSAVEP